MNWIDTVQRYEDTIRDKRSELNWIELNWIELNWTELSIDTVQDKNKTDSISIEHNNTKEDT